MSRLSAPTPPAAVLPGRRDCRGVSPHAATSTAPAADPVTSLCRPLQRRWSHPTVRVLLAGALVAVALVVAAGPVAAHATLMESSPPDGALLADPPTRITLTFSEDVVATPDAVRLIDPDGEEVSGIRSVGSGAVLTADVPAVGADGSYTVSWRVVSADGHPIRGAYLFHLRESTASEPVAAGSSGSLAADVLRAVGAILALAGAVLCLVAATGSSAARRRSPLRWVPVVAGAALLGAGSVVAVGSSVSASMEVVASTTSGRMAIAALGLSVAGLFASLWRSPRVVEAALAGSVVLAVSLQGHAVALAPVALSATATAAHVTAAVVWATGLFWLERRTRTAPDDVVRADVDRLSPFGMAVVVVVAGSGAWLLLDRVALGELLATNYGRLGLVKVVLLVAAVLIAARNWAVVRSERPVGSPVERSVAAGPTAVVVGSVGAAPALRRRVRVEMVVLALALVTGAVLAQVPPPSIAGTGQAPAGGVFERRVDFGDGRLDLLVEPGRPGVNEVHMTALGSDGRLMIEAEEFTLEVQPPGQGLGPVVPDVQSITAGHSVAYATIPFAGVWTFTVTSRVDRFREYRATLDVPVGP
jgi:copper transport protein